MGAEILDKKWAKGGQLAIVSMLACMIRLSSWPLQRSVQEGELQSRKETSLARVLWSAGGLHYLDLSITPTSELEPDSCNPPFDPLQFSSL